MQIEKKINNFPRKNMWKYLFRRWS